MLPRPETTSRPLSPCFSFFRRLFCESAARALRLLRAERTEVLKTSCTVLDRQAGHVLDTLLAREQTAYRNSRDNQALRANMERISAFNDARTDRSEDICATQ